MKPEVLAALERLEKPSWNEDEATAALDRAGLSIIRAALVEGARCEAIVQADREHVHYLGVNGHGGTVPV